MAPACRLVPSASVAELEACSECAGKGCHACRSTGHVRSQVEALRLERDRLTARVVELERELDDDVSPADQERLDHLVQRTMARYETRIEEQDRLATAEARVAELEANITSAYDERDRALGASEREARRADAAEVEATRIRIVAAAQTNEYQKWITELETPTELADRISALEDTIDLERAQLRSWRNAGGDPHVLAIISEIEYRRGAGWKGAR